MKHSNKAMPTTARMLPIRFFCQFILTILSLTITAQSNNNYVLTETMLDKDGRHKISSYEFFDGLGRLVQTSSNGIGGSGRCVNTYQTYDAVGNIREKWLPSIGKILPELLNDEKAQSLGEDTYGDAYPYFLNHYDALGRLTETETPGEVWHSAHKVVTKEYITNGRYDVRLYTAPMDGNDELSESGYYEPCQLYGERLIDEDGHALTVFTDKLKRKILERRNSEEGNNDTYFVYNDLGQLRFVLSPEYQNHPEKTIFGYEYRYDNRGNMVKKILPQCEYVQYWYDAADRLIYMQDGRMRSQGKYRFFLYDNLSRMVIEGICSNCNYSKTITQTSLSTSQLGFLGTGYTMSGDINLIDPHLKIVNYYDNYNFLNLPLFKGNTAFGKATAPTNPVCANGLQTGKIMMTNNGDLLVSSMYYDIKGNDIERHNTLPDNTLLVTKTVCSFTGNPINVSQTLYKNGKIYKVTTMNEYNLYNDNLSATTVSFDNTIARQTSNIVYDDLGRVKTLTRGGLSSTSYCYNLLGWTTDITNKHFEEHLTYNIGSQGNMYFNGNISSKQWKTSNDGILRGYKFSYDNLNRLTVAVYGEGISFMAEQGKYDERLSYTPNGAIKSIARNGLMQSGNYGAIDDLEITLNGNQLQRVDDKAALVSRAGIINFVDDKIRTDGTEYFYDANGALKQDANRGITAIEYDDNNNPILIQFNDGSQTAYVYTANCEKLRTIHRTATPNIKVTLGKTKHLAANEILSEDSTDYIDNFIFENGKIDKYMFNGGYYTYNDTGKREANYHYYITDHLVNNYMVVKENDTIEQVTHYYPFGTPINDLCINPGLQKYKYTGKELDLTHGLNTYDHGARQNYPLLSVWNTIDPLAEKYYNVSPYAVCGNNPTSISDISGKDWAVDSLGNAHYYASWNENTILPDGYKYYGETGEGFKDLFNGIMCCRLEKNGSVTDLYSIKDAVIIPSTNISTGLSAFSLAQQTKVDLFEYAIRERLKIGWGSQIKLNHYSSAKRMEIQSKAIGTGAAKYLKITKDLGTGATVLNTVFTINAFENDISNGNYIAGGARILTNGLIFATNAFPYVGPFISSGLGIIESTYGDYLYYYLQDKYIKK